MLKTHKTYYLLFRNVCKCINTLLTGNGSLHLLLPEHYWLETYQYHLCNKSMATGISFHKNPPVNNELKYLGIMYARVEIVAPLQGKGAIGKRQTGSFYFKAEWQIQRGLGWDSLYHFTVLNWLDIRKKPNTKIWEQRTSLTVQWLGLHTSTARGMDLISGWGAKIPHAKKCGPHKKIVNNLFCIWPSSLWCLSSPTRNPSCACKPCGWKCWVLATGLPGNPHH